MDSCLVLASGNRQVSGRSRKVSRCFATTGLDAAGVRVLLSGVVHPGVGGKCTEHILSGSFTETT